jgi:hypothetical protein
MNMFRKMQKQIELKCLYRIVLERWTLHDLFHYISRDVYEQVSFHSEPQMILAKRISVNIRQTMNDVN